MRKKYTKGSCSLWKICIAANCVLASFAAGAEHVYWSAWAQPLRRTPTASPGSPVGTVLSELDGRTIALGDHLYWIDDYLGVRRANLDGTNQQTILAHPPGYRYIPGLAIDEQAGKLYVSMLPSNNDVDPYLIKRTNLDGSGPLVIDAQGGTNGIAVDHASNTVCWSGNFPGSLLWLITCTDLGLANPHTITSDIHSNILGIATDPPTGKIYWSQADRIQRINFDGTGQETLISSSGIFGLAIDALGAKMYWVEQSHSIKRSDLTGTNPEMFFDVSSAGDNNIEAIGVGIGPEPAQAPPVPAVSVWGGACLTLALLIAGTHRIRACTTVS